MKTMKFIIKLFALLILGFALTYITYYSLNNINRGSLTVDDIEASYDDGINWLLDNQTTLINTHNPGLWEMMVKISAVTNHPELNALIRRYQNTHYARYRQHPLRFQVYGSGNVDYRQVELHRYPYYNLLFMYGHSCDNYLKKLDAVQEQLDVRFCRKHYPISPACKTHQLMGFLLLEKNSCEDPVNNKEVITALTSGIKQQLRFDFRVVDVYLQRVMMLLETENDDQLNPQWIINIINAQNVDGGWDDFMPLIHLPGNKAFGAGSKSFSFEEPQSNFHTTVQGVLLTAYLLHSERLDALNITE